MSLHKYPHLLEPLVLARSTVFRNRMFASATGPQYINALQVPNSATIAHYERRAKGGAAAVCFGDGMVDSEHGRVNWNHVPLDRFMSKAGLCYASEMIARHGAVPVMELLHAGKFAINSAMNGNPIYGPSEDIAYSVPEGAAENRFGGHGPRTEIPVLEMSEEMIEYTIQKYVDAALFAKNCGFGMVNIHGAHGWLITQFLSPLTNHRTDRWGGTLENRARFPIAVMDAIRRAVGPNFPIEMRFSGSECCPGGYDIDEAIAYAKLFDGHLDLLHVSAGQYSGAYTIFNTFVNTFPSMFSEDGPNLKFAAAIKPHVSVPIASVGGLSDAEFLEEAIASGKCDVVEMARQIICDPDTPRKYREGREDEVVKCMRCYACFSALQRTNNYACAFNPKAGLEARLMNDTVPAEKKTVLVAGGGMAGMTAALTADERGHRVILCEKTDRLGGVLLCEDEVPFKHRLAAYIRQTAAKIEKSGIEVRLNCEVTPELVEEIGADEVIAALGSEPAVPPVEGLDACLTAGCAVHAEDAFRAPDRLGDRVVILGCGLVGAELGIYLAGLGKQVEIVELDDHVNLGTNHLNATAIDLEFRRLGLEPRFLTRATKITGAEGSCCAGAEGNTCCCGELACEGPDGAFTLEFDTLVIAAGRAPKRAEAMALGAFEGGFAMVGDCLAAGDITAANQRAFGTALDIGAKF